jgi:hypothetical protein
MSLVRGVAMLQLMGVYRPTPLYFCGELLLIEQLLLMISLVPMEATRG